MRWFWTLAALACVCLSGAAVWLGGLNQDEGWYLYAANMVHDGYRVYRDFAFTQGPVMPKVYSAFTWVWGNWGLLGARSFTLVQGLIGILFAALTAKMLVPEGKRSVAALVVALLLGCNLYHLYFLAIPKTYALASVYVSMGVAMAVLALDDRKSARDRAIFAATSGLFLARAAGVRISLGAILPVVGVAMLLRRGWSWVCFVVGAVVGLCVAYGPVLLDPASVSGLVAAQTYHAARGGFDLVWVVGSLSRLVRWYLPVFIVLGLAVGAHGLRIVRGTGVLLASFIVVFLVQMAAPFPYEDYQVPIMGLLATFAAVNFIDVGEAKLDGQRLLLVLGLTFATSFGSPLLEKWTTNGQDRFWTLKKDKCEMAQLREAAHAIEATDPGGKDLLTQDLYLAVETNRKVPRGLEMGPFSVLTDAQWRDLLSSAPCMMAAVSGYTFAIEPPRCDERPIEQQMEYLKLLKSRYEPVGVIPDFGQNATTLLLLKRK